jgi:hypothetical protein
MELNKFFGKVRQKLSYHRDAERKVELEAQRQRGEAPPAQKRKKKDNSRGSDSSRASLFAAAQRAGAQKKGGRGGKRTSKTDYEMISDDETAGSEASTSRKRQVKTVVRAVAQR